MTNRNLKIIALFLLLLLLALGLACCKKDDKPAEPLAEPAVKSAAEKYVDYLDMSNWAYYGIGEDKPVDVFLICPTVDTKDEYNMSMDDEKTKEHFVGALNMERGLYEDTARMFAPYYRQAAMKVYSLPPEERAPYLDFAYRDVKNAFAWYLAHQNKGRPIILAGFSQGADMCYRLMEDYFGEGRDLISFDESVDWGDSLSEQLVAVYAIGWPCTQEMTEKNPQIVPAKAEDDIGVVVGFDCEAPEVTGTIIIPAGTKAYAINPLNWKTDSTPADQSENLGACFTGYDGSIKREIKALCGCYLDPERGALKVTDLSSADYVSGLSIFPEGVYHIYDYQFFYRNLQQNVRTRTEAYLAAADAYSMTA